MAEHYLTCTSREAFREWLTQNAASEKECFLQLKRGKPTDPTVFYYLDAVEEALCFGWIDSTLSRVNGVQWQRFTPRAKRSNWTELNKARVRRLERLGRMTDLGRAVVPEQPFAIAPDIEADIRSSGAWEAFLQMPPLYQRVRASNLAFTKAKLPQDYAKTLALFSEKTRAGRLYGAWNDYGRLRDDE